MQTELLCNEEIEMPKHHEMITVGDYQPLAGRVANTIRLVTKKYEDLEPGDTVRMSYVLPENLDEDGNVIGQSEAVELLTVSAVAIASLDRLLPRHSRVNHGRMGEMELRARLLELLYPSAKSTDLFMAIYFE